MSCCHLVCQGQTVPKSISSQRMPCAKKKHIPSASAIPVTRPENSLSIASPAKPPVGKPSNPIWRKTVRPPSLNELLSTPEPDTPRVQSQMGATTSRHEPAPKGKDDRGPGDKGGEETCEGFAWCQGEAQDRDGCRERRCPVTPQTSKGSNCVCPRVSVGVEGTDETKV